MPQTLEPHYTTQKTVPQAKRLDSFHLSGLSRRFHQK